MASTTPKTKTLSPALTAAVLQYFETHPAAKLGRNLRHLLLDYLEYELRIGVPVYIDELLWQMQDLFDLLDLAAKETGEWHAQKAAPPPKKKRRA